MDVEIKGGNLLKRSRNRSAWASLGGVNWQVRKISVSETRIAYGNVDGLPKDFIPLNSQTTCVHCDIDGKEFGFKVTTGTDELILVCDSSKERDEWVAAIKSVSGTCGDPELDRINDEKEAQNLNAEKAAVAAASSSLPSLGGLNILNAAEAAANRLKEQEEAAAAAAKAKLEAQAKLEVPNACMKKLSTEKNYFPRFIWINRAQKAFHWGKSDDITKSKSIDIPTMVKNVHLDNSIALPNITIELQNAESVFSSGLFSAAATRIDITMEDATKCAGFISFISELKYASRNHMTKVAAEAITAWADEDKAKFAAHMSSNVNVVIADHNVNTTGVDAAWEARGKLNLLGSTLHAYSIDSFSYPSDHVVKLKSHVCERLSKKELELYECTFTFDANDEKVVKFERSTLAAAK